MADCMMFPKDWHDFIKDYSFIDSEQVYTNGSELIQVFRVIQLIEHLLKEQEAVRPKSKVRHGANAQIQHFCGNCMKMLHGKPKFCSECGRPILWKGR